MKRIIAKSVFLALFALGCSERENAYDGALLTVNGKVLTKKELKESVGMMAALQRMGRTPMQSRGLGELRKQLSASYPEAFILNTLIAQYAAAENVTVTKEDLQTCQKTVLANCPDKGIGSFSRLVSRLGKYGDQLKEIVRREALRQAVRAHLLAQSPTNYPPEFAEGKIREIKEYNEMMDKTNVLIYARATNVWNKLKAGGDFKALAAKYSEVPEERNDFGEWGDFDYRQFQADPNVYTYVTTLREGAYTPPFEGDNGLMIMRMDKRNDRSGECSLSRIFFCLPMFAMQRTAKEIVEIAERERADKLFAEKMDELRKAAKIEYHTSARASNKTEGNKGSEK